MEQSLSFPPASGQLPPASRIYRFLRGLIRISFALFFRKIRLLHAEALPSSGAAILAVCRPPGFLDALILIAVFERQVHCLLNTQSLRGALKRWLARSLGMVLFDAEGDGWRGATEACCELLARGEAVVVFAEERTEKAESRQSGIGHMTTAAMLALEAESRQSFHLGLAVCPVHVFQPVAGARKAGMLIHVESPLLAQEYFRVGGSTAMAQAAALTTALESMCRENAFRLQPEQLGRFLAGLEEALRGELEEDWTSRPNWKQSVEGFELSRFMKDLVKQMNYLSPGRLVALCESLQAYQEARRRLSLDQFQIEMASGWFNSSWRRVWFWMESLLGLPVACYGLINHLLVWIVLFWAGLLKRDNGRSRTVEWLMRTLITLGCYAGQILLALHWWGKPVALYYGLSLPVSGAYLWRYGRLLRRRTRLLLLALRVPARSAKVRRMRKDLIEEVNASRNAYAKRLGIAH